MATFIKLFYRRESSNHSSVFRKQRKEKYFSKRNLFRFRSSFKKSTYIPPAIEALPLTWTLSDDSVTTSPKEVSKGKDPHLLLSCQILQASHALDEIERIKVSHSHEITELKDEISMLQKAMRELEHHKEEIWALCEEYEAIAHEQEEDFQKHR